MQDAKLIERFLLECALSSARTKQSFCALSHNSTDALDLFSRLWQIMKRHSDEIGETANEPTPQCLGSRDSVALTALIQDRKSTRLNSSHVAISYAVFC